MSQSFSNALSGPVHEGALLSRPLPLLPILVAQQMILLPLFLYVPIWVAGLNLLVVIFSFYRIRHPEFVIPKYAKAAITLAAVLGVLLAFKKLSGRDAGVALISVMYSLKIIEVYRRRDAFILLIMGFFMMVAAFLFSQKLWLTLYQFASVAAVLNALMSLHQINPGKANAVSLSQVLKVVSRYLFVAIPVMLVLFVFFPRLSSPIWRMPGAGQSASGISDTMSPGDVASLRLFEKVAFRVRFVGEVPKSSDMYWRAFVLDQFDGLTWTRAKKQLRQNKSIHLPESAKSFVYEMTLEQNQQNWLITLDRPLEVPGRAQIIADSAVYNLHRILDRTRYKAVSVPQMVLDPVLPQNSRRLNLRIPAEGDPRAKAYAAELRQQYQKDEDLINHLLREINQAPFYYTLSPPTLLQDTIDDFWFVQRRGFCEHYASAFVYLLRAAGIPARVVVGYQGAEKNPLADYYIVRYLNAHAWTEVWLADKGWVRVDPTAAIAPSRIEDDLLQDYAQREGVFDQFDDSIVDLNNLSLYKQLVYWMDEVNADWNEWALDFGQNNRRNLISSLGLGKLTEYQLMVVMIVLIAVFLGFTSLGWLKFRRPLPASAKLWTQLLEKLIRAGMLSGRVDDYKQLGPESVRQQVKTAGSPVMSEIDALFKEYQQLIYAGMENDSSALHRLALKIKRLQLVKR